MFKNLSQFKKNIKAGDVVYIDNKMRSCGIEKRIVIKVQTNCIITGIEISEDEYNNSVSSVQKFNDKFYKLIWLDFQKAKHMKFNDNKVEYLAYMKQPSYGDPIMSPSPDFNEGETWLTLEVER